MNIFKKQPKAPSAAAVQTARQSAPLSYLGGQQINRGKLALFSSLKQNIPLLDAAVCKIIRLLGGFSVTCGDKGAEKRLNEFLKTVPCGPAAEGIESFISAIAASLICYGTGIGEMIFSSDGRLCALYPAALSDVNLSVGDNPMVPVIATRDGKPLPHPERVLLCALSPDGEHPFGVSLFESLPFLSSVLLKIYECIGVNFERMGNLRFAVTYKPNDTGLGDTSAEEIAAAWSDAMKSADSVRDFIAVGDVDIKVIGGEVTMPDINIPVRTVLEQLIAKTGLPPFLLGLSWSSTERMSTMQVDILTSELEHYRSAVTPIILKICRAFLRGEGVFCEPQIEWNNISLQDELTLAQAALYRAQAEKLLKETGGEANGK